MLPLLTAGMSMLSGASGNGGSPLGALTTPDTPQTSQATSTVTAAQSTGPFSVGGSTIPPWLPWAIGGAVLAYLAAKARIL